MNIKKKSYRSHQTINERIKNFTKNLIILENNTDDFIYYVENNNNQNKKKYKFWELLTNNEK